MQVYKKLLFITSIGLCTLGAYTQTTTVSHSSSQGVSFPSMDSIYSPEMPTITAPVIGHEYYTPGVTQPRSWYTNPGTDNPSIDSTQKGPKTVTKGLSTLTASDLTSLSSLGINLNSLLNNNANLDTVTMLSNVATSDNSTETTELLKKVLNELEELKSQYANQPKTVEEPPKNIIQEVKHVPHILRFSVNGYDLLGTCRTVYISKQAMDGSFLITGDRKYQSDGNTRSETFHILFKASGASAGQEVFTTAAAVNQDYLNNYSFLYQLSQKDDIVAYKTGNMLTMRTDDPTWKLDLLIDLGE